MDCKTTYAEAIGKLESEVSADEYENIKKLVQKFDEFMGDYGMSARGALEDFAGGNISQAAKVLENLVTSAVEQEAKQTAREALSAFRAAAAKVNLQERVNRIAEQRKRGSDAYKRTQALSAIIASDYRSGYSLENSQSAMVARYIGQRFLQRIDKELPQNWTKLLNDEGTKKDVLREIFNITSQSKELTGNDTARKFASIIVDVRNEQRAALASHGVNVSRANSIPVVFEWASMKAAGRDKFVSEMAQALSEKTHGDVLKRTAIASEIFDHIEQRKGLVDWRTLGEKTGLTGPNDYNTRPTIDYGNADAWIKLNDSYGQKDLLESVNNELQHNAKEEALVRMFGPNPDRTFADVLNSVQLDQNGFRDGSAAHAARKTEALYQRLTKVSVPEWARWSQFNAIGRSLRTASDLGGAVVAGLTDVPVLHYTAKAFLNVPAFRTASEAMGNAFSKEARERTIYVGAFAEGMSNNIGQKFGTAIDRNDKISRTASDMANWTLRMTGLEAWTSAGKTGALSTIEAHLGLQIQQGVKFNQLPNQLRASLERFDIRPEEWNSLNRDNLNQRGRFDVYTLQQGMSEAADLQHRMNAWMIEQTETMILSPSLRDRYYSTFGFDPSSAVGTAIASMTQFLSFPIAFGRKIVARTMWGNEDSVARAATNTATLVLVTTAVGALVVQSKEMLQGKKPYSYADGDFWLKAVQAGGGFGIVSDNVLKFGGEGVLKTFFGADEVSISNMASLLGPLYSYTTRIAFEGAKGVGHLAWGDEDKAQAEFSKMAQDILKSVPGRSIWWFAAVYRAAVLDNVAYMIDPHGYREAQLRNLTDTKSRAENLFSTQRPSRNENFVAEGLRPLKQGN
jgi:hypothetical protein